MELECKPDAEEAKERVDAWWRGEVLDRVPIKVVAPLMPPSHSESAPQDPMRWRTDPELVIPRLEAYVDATFWGGEALPLVFPAAIGMVAILAAYLGCPYRFLDTQTAWAEPIIDDWESAPALEFNPANKWWQTSGELLKAAAERAPGRYYVGLPDLNGPGEILARLRSTEGLLFDLMDNPGPLRPALDKINFAWLRYYEACVGIVHQYVEGSIYWMGIWSLTPSIDLQCDFSCMISAEMFDELFLPPLREQTEWVDRTIYHLDGPGAIRHLDSLLALPKLKGIQWVPGAGAPPMREWVDLCRRILEAGKLLYIACEPDEVQLLLSHLPHEGLLLDTHCQSREAAEGLLKNVALWSG